MTHATARLAGLVVVLGLSLATAACAAGGAAPGAPQGPQSPAGPTGDASGPPPMPDAATPATPALTPVSPVAGTRARMIRFTAAGRAEEGRVLLLDVAIGGPPCDVVTAADVVESAGTVTVTVYAGVPATATCDPKPAAVLATARVQVRLAEPLGTRTLVDGAAG